MDQLKALGQHSGEHRAHRVVEGEPIGVAEQPEQAELGQDQRHPPGTDLCR